MSAPSAAAATSELRTIDAIRAALRDELAADDSVVVLGEDVTVGGPFGATAGLAEEFGATRIRNTPISEGTIVGLAVGAAARGLRPIVEIMFIDFATLAMDQLVNHAAKLRYMSGGQLTVPLTIRVQGGASGAFGAHHSQSLEAWFAHVPGLRVVAPSTPADAYGLLRAAIRDPDPVLVIEHRALYWGRGPVETGDAAIVPIGRAAIRRPGRDVTLISYSRMAQTTLAAADLLAADGVEAEVLDLRTISPLDTDAILESVRRTRRAVVAHEAVVPFGVGAEVAATIGTGAFDVLAAPVERVGAPFAPPPASPILEAAFVPDAAAIAAAARRTLDAPPRTSVGGGR
ncbi:MAG TPA: pyruvate dehydrogenase complex E1 component subunit beta [Candidatus Limnocylindrales bacterium]|nr:pyruvate dehydrogenase complex E1 component subunit beta [Candidatus Limnocylindrales bacterium]